MDTTLSRWLAKKAANLISDNEKSAAKDMIPGGLADKTPPSRFNPKAVAKGQKVEMEHTNNPTVAREIARDHLQENRRYYTLLAQVEDQFERGGKSANKKQRQSRALC